MGRLDLLKQRTSELLIDLIGRNRLSNRKLGEIMGCGRNTISNYRQKKTTPNQDFLTKLMLFFGVNMNWLFHGRGPRYHGDGQGPMQIVSLDASDDRLASGMAKTACILTSDTPAARSLALLIEHFDRGERAMTKHRRLVEEEKRLRARLESFDREANES